MGMNFRVSFLVLFCSCCLIHGNFHRAVTNGKGLIKNDVRRYNVVASRPEPHQRFWRSSTSPNPSSSTSSFDENENDEENQPVIPEFFNRDSRLGFIRKVYNVFGFQCLGTIAVLLYTQKNLPFQRFLQRSASQISVTSGIATIGIIFLFGFFKRLRQTFPYNFILLSIFTLAYSLFVSLISLQYNPQIVLMSLVYTILSFTAITAYSFQNNPKYDLSALGNTLFAALSTILIGQVLNGLFFHAPFMENLLCIGSAILFAGYIAYDTQLIISGRKTIKSFSSQFFPKKNQFSPSRAKGRRRFNDGAENDVELTGDGSDSIQPAYYDSKDFIFAAMNLYVDVIGLFLQLMELLSKVERKDKE